MIDMFAKSNKKQSSVKPAESEWLGVGWDLGDTHLIYIYIFKYMRGRDRDRERERELGLVPSNYIYHPSLSYSDICQPFCKLQPFVIAIGITIGIQDSMIQPPTHSLSDLAASCVPSFWPLCLCKSYFSFSILIIFYLSTFSLPLIKNFYFLEVISRVQIKSVKRVAWKWMRKEGWEEYSSRDTCVGGIVGVLMYWGVVQWLPPFNTTTTTTAA